MEESNIKRLKRNDEIVKEKKCEFDNIDEKPSDYNDKNQEQVVMKIEGGMCLGDTLSNTDESTDGKCEIKQACKEKIKLQLDDKESKSIEDREQKQQQIKWKIKKEVHHDVSLSNTEESTTSKRARESDEIEVLSTKKLKSETIDVKRNETNEDNNENQTHKIERIRKEEESHILRLFTCVLDTIIARKNIEDVDIAKSISPIKYSFIPREINSDVNITFHETDFTLWENICAYLYRYGSHGAGFARYRILNAIRNCKKVENILKKPDLKIIVLGSGPGNDAVGLCSALSELQYPNSLKLTLVDKFGEWNECIELVESFIKSQNFGKVSEFFQRTNVDLQFMQVDLPGDLKSDEKYFKILGKADVIVASKFFTSLDRKNYGKFENSIIKSLQEHMKEGAVILVNDQLVYIENRWIGFQECKWEKEKDIYLSTVNAKERFNSAECTESKLPVYVFVKESAQ